MGFYCAVCGFSNVYGANYAINSIHGLGGRIMKFTTEGSKALLKLNLQHFAEGEELGTDNQEELGNEGQEAISFANQSEFDSVVDKRISKALETARTKWEADKEAAVSEAEKLAKMNAAERKEAEEQARIATLEKREKELNMREYRYEAKTQLEENSLPTEFVDMVISDDAETTKSNITALKTAFDKAVEAKVQESLKGSTPKATTQITEKNDLKAGLGL